jgi:hypothetical protein
MVFIHPFSQVCMPHSHPWLCNMISIPYGFPISSMINFAVHYGIKDSLGVRLQARPIGELPSFRNAIAV